MRSIDRAGLAAGRTIAADRLLLGTFAAAILLSAFLLFAVQPMFAKMILPRLGGSSAVWSVTSSAAAVVMTLRPLPAR